MNEHELSRARPPPDGHTNFALDGEEVLDIERCDTVSTTFYFFRLKHTFNRHFKKKIYSGMCKRAASSQHCGAAKSGNQSSTSI